MTGVARTTATFGARSVSTPLLLASLFAAGTARGAESVNVADLLRSPDRLMAWVSTHHGEARAAWARVGQAEADVAQSRLRPNPALTGSLGDWALGTTNPPGLSFTDTAIWGIALTQTIELAKREPRVASADARLDAARFAYRDSVAQAAADARSLLARVVFLKARQETLDEGLSAAREVLALQRVREQRGDISGNDFDRVRLDTLDLEADVALNRSDYDTARDDCGAVLTAPCDPAGASLDLLTEAMEAPQAAGSDESVQHRPDLQALEASAVSADEDATLAHRRPIPDPAIGVSYTRDKLVISGDQPRQLGVSLSFALPLFDRGQADAARAELRAVELRAKREATLRKAQADAESLRTRNDVLTRTLAALRDEAAPTSRSILEATLSAVNQGELSMTDYLLARRTHTDVVLKLMQTELDVFEVRNQLRLALGLDAPLVPEPSPRRP